MKRLVFSLTKNLYTRSMLRAATDIDKLIKTRIIEYALAERKGNEPRSKQRLIEQIEQAWDAADREDR